MSVQVRRRRETAAFLSTFVGAQGELLVDTTNNRVQVHDGATPGGFPAARLADLPSSSAPLAVAQGGTGAATPKAARANLGLDAYTAIGDANYTVAASDRTIALTATLTAPRTLTLPAASSFNAGASLRIVDQAGGVSSTNTLTIAAAGSDTLNGAATAVFKAPFTDFSIVTDGAGKWTYDVQGLARGGTGGTSASAARGNLGAAASGANADITSLAGLTTPLAIGQGGTGAVSASGALAALGAIGRTSVADTSYTALASDRTIALTSLTASRTVTLPSASAYPTGTQLLVVDESGACSATNTIIVARSGSDTINAAASLNLSLAYGYVALVGNGSSKWTVVDQSTASMAQQASSAVAITGGSVNGTIVGTTTPAAGAFTTLTASSGLVVSAGVSVSSGGLVVSSGSVRLPSYTVATLPAAGTAGRVVYCSNARMQTSGGTLETAGAGTGGLVVDNGSAWKIAGTNITTSA